MRPTFRTTIRLLGIASLTVLLSGCLKATQDLTLNEDDTVDGTIVFAVDKGVLELAGMSADDFLEQVTEGDSPVPGDVEFETEPYEDDEYIGSEFTFEGAPLSAFNDPEAGDLAIVREGDTFVVSGTLDASTEDLDPTGTPGADQLLESFDVRISITFPGEVEEASGEIDGTTVTWTPALGETTEISARGSAIGSGGGSGGGATLWIVLGAIAVLVVIVIAVVMGRKKPAPAGEVPPADAEVTAPPADDAAIATPPPPAPVTEPMPTPEPTAELSTPDTPDTPDVGGSDGGGGSD
jgi:hypothetical protein